MLYEKLHMLSPAAETVFSVALMMLAGFLMTRLTKLLRLPNVTAYLVVGILLGPYCLGAIPRGFIEDSAFLSDIALALISFSTGEFFRLSALARRGARVLVLTLFETCFAFFAVFFVLIYALHVDFSLAVMLSALAAATAPASTLMTIRQTGAHGEFVDTLLQVIALDNMLSLLAYSVAVSLAASAQSGALAPRAVWMPILKNLGAMLLGALFGALMCLLIRARRSDDNRLIISVALLLAFCGVCILADISPLLGCMSMGMVYTNVAHDAKLFRQLGYFSPPFLLLFFVRSGAAFDVSALFTGKSAGGATLLAIGLVYFAVRTAGKYAGAFCGGVLTRASSATRGYLGLALIPQAGVSVGLATLGARTLGGETGSALLTVILTAGLLYELVGPALAKLALCLAGAYAPPVPAVSEEEHAFSEAAEEHAR